MWTDQLFCIRNVLRRMGNLAGEAVPTADPAWFTTYETVYAPVQGIFVRCVEAGTDVKAGRRSARSGTTSAIPRPRSTCR